MSHKHQLHLSKRERQVMDVVYRRKEVSAKEVWREIPDFPSYSAVRSVLSILEQKGLLTHIAEGKKYIYSPTITHEKAMHSAVRQLVNTYFDGSLEKAVTAMLEIHNQDITDAELKTLAEIIERVRKEDEGKDVTNDT